jgi:hypothetical protein
VAFVKERIIMKTRSRRLGFESLERRTMMTGTVSAFVVGNQLNLLGISGGNTVALTAGAGAGNINMVANGGAVQSFSGVQGISAELLGGNSQLNIGSSLKAPIILKQGLAILEGGGNNVITTFGVAASAIAIGTVGSTSNISSLTMQYTATPMAQIWMGNGVGETLTLTTSIIAGGSLTGGTGAILKVQFSYIAQSVLISGF